MSFQEVIDKKEWKDAMYIEMDALSRKTILMSIMLLQTSLSVIIHQASQHDPFFKKVSFHPSHPTQDGEATKNSRIISASGWASLL